MNEREAKIRKALSKVVLNINARAEFKLIALDDLVGTIRSRLEFWENYERQIPRREVEINLGEEKRLSEPIPINL